MEHKDTPINILLVDDDPVILDMVYEFVLSFGYMCDVAENYDEAMAKYNSNVHVIALVDIGIPGKSGIELLKHFSTFAPRSATIMITGLSDLETAVETLKMGAYDFVQKPFTYERLKVAIEKTLEKRKLQLEILDYQSTLEKKVLERTKQLKETQNAALFGLSSLAESRDLETGKHLERIRGYSTAIAEELYKEGKFKDILTKEFINNIYETSPLHDIGKVGIPDNILLKPDKLTDEEFELMKKHTIIGGQTLEEAEKELKYESFLRDAKDIAYYHHERYDGTGYPHQLKGEEIPLSARIVALADFYDALTSSRIYRPYSYNHDELCNLIISLKGKHFDPCVVDAFIEKKDVFLEISRKNKEEE